MQNNQTFGQENNGPVLNADKERLLDSQGNTILKGMDEQTKLIIFCTQAFKRHVKLNTLLAVNFAF